MLLLSVIDSQIINPLSAKFIKWSNTLKQIVDKLPAICLSAFDHFLGLAFKGLIDTYPTYCTYPTQLAHVLKDIKKSYLASVTMPRKFLIQINMERGHGAMAVDWTLSCRIQRVYQAFSHSLRYIDFISKVRNHDQIGN